MFAHLLGKPHRVVGADLEGDDRADVAEDGVGGLVVELGQILVGDDQGEAVLAGLTEDGGEAAGGEVLELVDVEAEVAAVGLGDVGPGHRSLLDMPESESPYTLFPFACPCCGYNTLGCRSDWDICPICWWEVMVKKSGLLISSKAVRIAT